MKQHIPVLNNFSNVYIDFSRFKTEQELFEETGLRPEEALGIINQRIERLKDR